MLKIIMTKGLPASGKTSWANEYVKSHPEFVIICKDDFRNSVLKENNVSWSKEVESTILIPYWIKLIETNLTMGNSVISADTNLALRNENILKSLAEKYNAELTVISFLDVPIETCIARDSIRPKDTLVGEKKIRQQYKNHILPQLRKKSLEKEINICEKYNKIFNWNIKTILCDIDGTIALMQNRSPFEWQKVYQDLPVNQVLDILKSLQKTGLYEVVFLSGRDDECMELTKQWLKNVAKIEYSNLYMRKNKDLRADTIVKEEIYNQYLSDKNIAFVIDDRTQVVKMWHKLGLFVLDVNQSGLDF